MGKDQATPTINIPAALTGLLACQLAGEVLVGTLRLYFPGLGFPGPVAGMALLFAWLAWRGGPGASMDATTGAILRNLSLLFVPAAVGVMQYGDILSRYGFPLLLALVVSTLLTLLVTVGVFLLFSRGDGESGS